MADTKRVDHNGQAGLVVSNRYGSFEKGNPREVRPDVAAALIASGVGFFEVAPPKPKPKKKDDKEE